MKEFKLFSKKKVVEQFLGEYTISVCSDAVGEYDTKMKKKSQHRNKLNKFHHQSSGVVIFFIHIYIYIYVSIAQVT